MHGIDNKKIEVMSLLKTSMRLVDALHLVLIYIGATQHRHYWGNSNSPAWVRL